MAQRRLSFDQPTPLRVTPVTPAQLNRIRQVDLGDVVKKVLAAIPAPPGSSSTFSKQEAKFSGSERDLAIVWRTYHYTLKRYATKTSAYVEALFSDDIPLVRADDGRVVEPRRKLNPPREGGLCTPRGCVGQPPGCPEDA